MRYERGRTRELRRPEAEKLGRIPPGGGKRFAPGFAETRSGPAGPLDEPWRHAVPDAGEPNYDPGSLSRLAAAPEDAWLAPPEEWEEAVAERLREAA